jgi:hypothetical protein
LSKTRRVPYPGTLLYLYIYLYRYPGTRVQLLPYIRVPGYPVLYPGTVPGTPVHHSTRTYPVQYSTIDAIKKVKNETP